MMIKLHDKTNATSKTHISVALSFDVYIVNEGFGFCEV